MEVLGVLYFIAGYWAAGVVFFQNKVVIHRFGALAMLKLTLGGAFGFILIPVALIMKLLKIR